MSLIFYGKKNSANPGDTHTAKQTSPARRTRHSLSAPQLAWWADLTVLWFTCMCPFPSGAHMLLSLWMIRELGRGNPRTFPLYLRRKGVCLGPECWKFHWQMSPSSLECLCPVFRICSHQRAPGWPVHKAISVLRPETLSKVLRPHWSSAAAMSCFVPLAASL